MGDISTHRFIALLSQFPKSFYFQLINYILLKTDLDKLIIDLCQITYEPIEKLFPLYACIFID